MNSQFFRVCRIKKKRKKNQTVITFCSSGIYLKFILISCTREEFEGNKYYRISKED